MALLLRMAGGGVTRQCALSPCHRKRSINSETWLKEIAVKQSTTMRREFSARSMLLHAVFVITFVAAGLTDLAGFLQYIGLVSGLPGNVLEMGAIMTAATGVPLLAMGMSFSADLNHSK